MTPRRASMNWVAPMLPLSRSDAADADGDPPSPACAEHPVFRGAHQAFGFDMLQAVTLGLVKNGMITRDQVTSLTRDNVVTRARKALPTSASPRLR